MACTCLPVAGALEAAATTAFRFAGGSSPRHLGLIGAAGTAARALFACIAGFEHVSAREHSAA